TPNTEAGRIPLTATIAWAAASANQPVQPNSRAALKTRSAWCTSEGTWTWPAMPIRSRTARTPPKTAAFNASRAPAIAENAPVAKDLILTLGQKKPVHLSYLIGAGGTEEKFSERPVHR